MTLKEDLTGTSVYTATDPDSQPISDTKEITWSQTDSGVITVVLGTDSGSGANLPNITLTPIDGTFTSYKSGDGVDYHIAQLSSSFLEGTEELSKKKKQEEKENKKKKKQEEKENKKKKKQDKRGKI